MILRFEIDNFYSIIFLYLHFSFSCKHQFSNHLPLQLSYLGKHPPGAWKPGYGKRIISTNLLLFASSNFRISSRCLQLALAWRNKINNQFPSSFCLFVSSFLPIFLQVPTAPALVRRKYNNQFLFCLF